MDGRRGRSKHIDLLALFGIPVEFGAQSRCQFFRRRLNLASVGAFHTDVDKAAERRITQGSAEFDLSGKETSVIVIDEVLNRLVIRRVGLDYHRAGFVPSPASARNLAEELKGSLRRTKIRDVQR